MDIHQPLTLLGGLTPQQFMKRHWQKKPLLVRQAVPGFQPLLERGELFELAASEAVESRLVRNTQPGWAVRSGPLPRRSLPALSQPDWTLLVQGVDLHDEAVHHLMQGFRFIPDARLDDLMISYATPGGGVGPHFDSYDVFLLQAHGKRRWRIGRQKDLSLREDTPLKVLANFEPEEEFVLEPGDMLYLPPRYAHDGIAEDECMTYSIGFRSPKRDELAREVLQRLAEDAEDLAGDGLYRDPTQPAVADPAAIPEDLHLFAADALQRVLNDPDALARVIGEYLTEPKAQVWFDSQEDGEPPSLAAGVRLDRRTRMLHDERHVFINGEGFRAAGRDATLMRQLASLRVLGAKDVARLSAGARELLLEWCQAGWLHPIPTEA
ncbi:cupin domain-containing protein [Curvibacter sp. HBC28]|uniref:Cupin domain-containing protein n=1 Tax=Curvibacter microcysteis TaxID=3026419 RepID=A0ABT5MK13_9BURK|nr:cupin domain-containing protein [Curvibacter sp. HBC28]MDD0816918.1 cupin domain-containing protein [Curvibacter sp. HBC28]